MVIFKIHTIILEGVKAEKEELFEKKALKTEYLSAVLGPADIRHYIWNFVCISQYYSLHFLK